MMPTGFATCGAMTGNDIPKRASQLKGDPATKATSVKMVGVIHSPKTAISAQRVRGEIRHKRPKTDARIPDRAALSVAVKASGLSLSISKTAISFPCPLRTGSTISDRVDEEQAM